MEKSHKERIEQYMDGLLSADEKRVFEDDLQRDPSLSDAFETYLRDSHLLLEDESTAPDTDRLDEAVPKGSRGSEEHDFEAKKTEVVLEGAVHSENDKEHPRPEEKNTLSTYLRPLAIFLLGLSFFFFIQRKCESDPPVPEFLEAQGQPSDIVQEEMPTVGEGILDDIAERPADVLPEAGELEEDTAIANSYAPPPPTKEETADCNDLIKKADRYYKNGDYEAAQVPLALIVQSENPACQADAWFYLGLIRLKLGDPEGTLQCLAKVDNLEKYGQDVQWYMALAFYDLSESDFTFKDRAKRAFEHLLKSQQSEERRKKAQEIIEKLENS